MERDVRRFVYMHELFYPTALEEIKNGQKRSHWMWYIFPQLKGLGYSITSDYYGIDDSEEAREYMKNEYLRHNMLEICRELVKIDDSADNIFGILDNVKLKSSMTLFEYAVPEEDIFKEVIDKFYDGDRDQITLRLLNKSNK